LGKCSHVNHDFPIVFFSAFLSPHDFKDFVCHHFCSWKVSVVLPFTPKMPSVPRYPFIFNFSHFSIFHHYSAPFLSIGFPRIFLVKKTKFSFKTRDSYWTRKWRVFHSLSSISKTCVLLFLRKKETFLQKWKGSWMTLCSSLPKMRGRLSC